MATPEDVRNLAALARITVSESEVKKFTEEFDAILSYIGTLEKLELPDLGTKTAPAVRNVFREDGEPHAKGVWTKKLVEQFPACEGGALSVKQILSHD